MRANYKKVLFFLVGVAFFVACAEKDEMPCNGNNVPCLNLAMQKVSEKHIDSLWLFNDNLEKPFFKWKNVPLKTKIPLNINADKTNFILKVFNGKEKKEYTDTITFDYSTTVKSEDVECGFTVSFELYDVNFTHNSIDSLFTEDVIVDIKNAQNIKIYL